MAAAKRVRVARIGAAHGVRGEVRLHVYADDPRAIEGLGPLEDETGARRFRIVSLRAANDRLIARFEGVDNRTAAKRIARLDLYLPRARLPELERDRYYHADLIGLQVETVAGQPIGTVVAVQNFGAGDLLEIAPLDGGANAMLPFVDRFVPKVDVARGRIVIDPPLGVFESSRISVKQARQRTTVRRRRQRSAPSRRAARVGLSRKGRGEKGS